MIATIQALVDRALRAVKLPISAVVQSSTPALLYVLKNAMSAETRNDIENLQHYGLVSRLPAGTKVIVLPLKGMAENLVIISEKHKTALVLAEGDVALERTTGEHVWLKAGEIYAKADKVTADCDTAVIKATTSVTIDTPAAAFTGTVTIAGTLGVTGLITATGGVMSPAAISGLALVAGAGGIADPAGVLPSSTAIKTHTHNENGTGGGVTNAPNGM